MKFIKFIYTPMKFVLLLGMIAAVIYFRSIIFQPNINQYINAGLSFAEDKLDISIPSHISRQVEAVAMVVHEECEFNEPKIVETAKINNSIPVQPEAGEAESDIEVAEANSMANDIESDDASLIDGIAEALEAVNKKVDTMFEDSGKQASVESIQDDVAKAETPDQAPVSIQPAATDVAIANEKDAIASNGNQADPDNRQVLMMARQSYWAGKLHESEAYYLNLAKLNDGEPDVYGELGNVYYAQGKWQQAGQAYYQAAIRLLATNQNEKNSKRVSYLLRVIQGLDKESAEKLKNEISG